MEEVWRGKVQCGVVGSSFVTKYVTRCRAGEFGWVMKNEESEKVIFIGGVGLSPYLRTVVGHLNHGCCSRWEQQYHR